MAGKNVIKEELARKAGCIEEKNRENISSPAKEDEEKGGAGDMAETGKCSNSGEFVRLLRADEIECRVAMVNEKGLSLLLFKDARVDQKILDESFTPFGWRRTHQSIDGNLYCTVEIWDKEKCQWIAKQDVGTVSYSEKEKGQASDSFKRACFNWGLGRELYTAPFIWLPAEKVDIKLKGDRYVTSERFSVQSISYNEQREIVFLVIVNSKGYKVFETGKRQWQGQDAGRNSIGSNAVDNKEAGINSGIRSTSTDTGTGIITDIQRRALEKELQRTGVLLETVLGRYSIYSMDEMTEEIYTKALNSLKRTKSKAA